MRKTIRELLIWGVGTLQGTSPTPRLDVELLLCHSLDFSRTEMIAHLDSLLQPKQVQTFKEVLKKRANCCPVAYIVGSREFWGLEIEVGPEVLVPRPETELLVERALSLATIMPPPLRIADLGTGSGCIVAALCHELGKLRRSFHVVGLDRSRKALLTAKRNLTRLALSAHSTLVQADWCTPFNIDSFDIIVSNPPYVSADESLAKDLSFEPQEALFAKDEGYAVIKQLLAMVPTLLRPGGTFLCEIGAGQRRELERYYQGLAIATSKDFGELEFHEDLAGIDRVLELGRIVCA